MTREEAVNDLNTIKEFFEEKGGAYPASLEYAIEALKNEVEDRQQEWIPCSERSPEKEGYYLVTTRRFAFCDTIYETRPAFRSSTNRWVRVGGSEVLAWMPLPEPWKGADDFAKTHEIVANGNCAICGKPLSGDRVFVCEECNNNILLHQKVEGER